MKETLILFRKHIRIIWCYRWLALISAVLVCVVGWLVVLKWPDQYQASTIVFLNSTSSLAPVLRGLALESDAREDTVQMVRRTLLTRPNLEAVARKTDMDLTAKSPDEFERTLQKLQGDIKVAGTYRDNIFDIRYVNSDPKLATNVVEALLNVFLEKSLGANRTDASKTRNFVQGQIEEYRRQLEAAEKRLKEFKQRNVGLLPGEGRGYYTQLQEASAQLTDAELQKQEATRRRDELSRQLLGEEPTFGLGPSILVAASQPTSLDQRISAMESRLDELLLQFTDQHPDVISARRVLDDLRAQHKKQLAALNRQQPDVPVGSENPVYQGMKIALGQAEGEVAALGARVEEYQRRKTELEKLVDTVPEIEAELIKLNRDYDIYKANYEALVQRREALNLSDEASQTEDSIQFNIVEPPREPMLPIGPPRAAMNLTVLVLGLGSGAGFAWLVAMLRPGIYTKEDFGEITDLPVLGVVSQIWTPTMLFNRRLEVATFGLGFLCLMGLFAGVYAIDFLNIDVSSRLAGLDPLLEKLARLLP